MSSLIHFYYALIERLFDVGFNARAHALFQPSPPARYSTLIPSTKNESKDTNTVAAIFELPGLQPEDVAIDLQENRLTVSSAASSRSDERSGYVMQECRFGKFLQTLKLPFGTKAEDVKAKLENGVLTVTFPKANPEQEPQHITIQ